MSTTARPAIPTLQQIRSERAKKAAQTRRLKKLEEQRQAAQQADLRAQLYAKLTGEQRDQIDSIISTPFINLDDEYETRHTRGLISWRTSGMGMSFRCFEGLPLTNSDSSASSSTAISKLNEQRVWSVNSRVKHFLSSLFQ